MNTRTPPAASPSIDVETPAPSASDTVFTGIVRGLETHAFVPGQRLSEAELVARFEVGRNSVREAFQRLAAEGIVVLSRHKGAAIRSLSQRETLDVLAVAERMTGLLARTATRAAGDKAMASALEKAVRALGEADQARDPAAFATARRHFYRCLLEMGGNRELQRLFPTIQMPIVYAQHSLPSLQKIRLADYRRIAAAVLSGDAAKADRAGVAHVAAVRKAILAV